MNFLTRLALAVEKHKDTEPMQQSRRVWMQNFGVVAATSAVLWSCGSKDSDKATADTTATENPVADGAILNSAIALEHEAISLYTQAAGLPVWTADTKYGSALLAIAGSFLEHHKGHLSVLQQAITALKVKDAKVADAPAASDDAVYLKAATDAGYTLANTTSVLQLAAAKEAGAAKAYVGAIQALTIKDYAYQSGLHSGDESAHYGALRAALFALLGDAGITGDKVVPAQYPTGFTATGPS